MENILGRNLDQTGQHYMHDTELVKFIVKSALLSSNEIVLEVGYGTGILTRQLAKKSKVIAIDIDGNCDELTGVKFVKGNILDEYWNLKKQHHFNKIVSNIPYNLSEPLMRIIFKDELDMVVLTVGKNFSDLLSREDNRIGIIANDMFDVQILKNVHPSSFRPMPRVYSSVVRLVPKKDSVYRKIVSLDEKKIKNILELTLGKTKKDAKDLIQNLGKIGEKTIYKLSNKEFQELNNLLKYINVKK